MIPKCPICSSHLNHEDIDSRPVLLKACGAFYFSPAFLGLYLTRFYVGHVLCFPCFHSITKNPPFLCPFRCGAMPDRPAAQHRLNVKDGRFVHISLKKAEPLQDTNAAIEKSVLRRPSSAIADR